MNFKHLWKINARNILDAKFALWLLPCMLSYRWNITHFVLFDFWFNSLVVGFASFTFLLVRYFSFDCYIYSFSESFLAF